MQNGEWRMVKQDGVAARRGGAGNEDPEIGTNCGKKGSRHRKQLAFAGVCRRTSKGAEGSRSQGAEGLKGLHRNKKLPGTSWDYMGLPGTGLVRNGEERMTGVDNGCFATFQSSFEAARGMGAVAREPGTRRLDAPLPMPISLAQCFVRAMKGDMLLWGRGLGTLD